MTLLSSSFDSMSNSVSAIEYPTDLTFYLRKIVAYVTYAMISVAALVLIFVGLSRGHVEVLNLLELQRVGAIVWIGRPLLFVRSLTAVGLLSTANLALVYNGFVSYFIVTQNPWYKTLLAANEVTWMVAIVNDIAMAFTREHTIYYATINSILVWLATAILGLTTPVQHSATTNKQCSVIQMDFQVVCTSGVVAIGRLSRLALILGMVLGFNLGCFVIAKCLVRRQLPPAAKCLFLYAGTRYLFMTNRWTYKNVYYMDRASAILNGILTLRWKQAMFGLDIKLWRTFRVDLWDESDIPVDHPLSEATSFALLLCLEGD
ncbi:Aste57867_3798 [Aphanomyces stellatus]|uniref:Aste57867_3798 protein n=1 Tax=Aphanomyces stellatus TaxID=120398 RepID=A0A485KCT3_9STRA|nr:hypothetical protein As57867_003787 [Aphanomyces stellatus]VFT80948.1 Aste57867_3798 [Aphanomyces stellatus]